jgi:hypothetical protein
MKRSLFFFSVVLLCACPPVGETPDDDDVGGMDSLHVMAEGDVVASGETYCTPLNACHEDNVVSLFSEQRTSFSIQNGSDADIAIDRVYLTEASGNMDEEWTLIDTELVPSPLAVDGSTLAPGAAIDFYPRFYPVQSGERNATISIEFDGGSTYSFEIVGQGSYDSYFLGDGLPSSQWLYGGMDSDELTGGGVMLDDGAMVVTSNASEVIDGFTTDLLVACIEPDGTLRWAKIWNGPYQDQSPDPGQNSESGGSADSIALGDDGFVYVAGRTSQTNSNSTFYSLLLKIDPADGSMVWEKVHSPRGGVSIASDSSAFYGVDAMGGKVYATGATLGESEVALVRFDAATGDQEGAWAFDVHDGYNDRGYSVRVDSAGAAWIGGNGNGDAILLKIDGADGNSPSVAWAQQPGLGTGGNINSMTLDGSDDAYVAYDIRGASSHLVFGKVSSDGTLDWSREYVANAGDKNNVHVVRWIDGMLYVGGRTGPSLLDGQMGDGFMAAVDADGLDAWTAEYFSGKGTDELCEHRVKALGTTGDSVVALMQAYTGTANYERYWGYWYEGSGAITEATITGADRSATTEVTDLVDAEAEDAAAFRNDWVDAPTTVVLQTPVGAEGQAPDASLLITTIEP